MITISESPGEALRTEVLDLLLDHAAAKGVPFTRTDLAFEAREDGRLMGGLVARISQGWMYVELLAVTDAARGQGWGRRLLDAAEAEARRRGLTGLWLDTFSFQAPDFYRALGFEEVGRIEDYPIGEARIFFRKRLG